MTTATLMSISAATAFGARCTSAPAKIEAQRQDEPRDRAALGPMR